MKSSAKSSSSHPQTSHASSRRTLLSAAACLSAFSLLSVGGSSAHAEALSSSKLPPLKVTVDLEKVDLEAHHLEVRMSREAERVVIKVFTADGLLIDEVDQSFKGKAAGAALVIHWKQKKDQSVARIDVYAYDDQGYYKAVRIVPWSLSIPHEDVQFKTNSAAIAPAEEHKLEASYTLIESAVKKHSELGRITLFIAGHTDTKGRDAHNLQLSRARARAIALWFRKRGHKGPLAYEGFGEHSPKVATKDEVDEAKNRRVDYLLGLSPPRVKVRGMVPSWKKL